MKKTKLSHIIVAMKVSEILLSRREFDPRTYQETPDSPRAIIAQTDFVISTLFSNEFIDKGPAIDHLENQALPFIDKALGAVPIFQLVGNDLGTDDYGRIKAEIGNLGSPDNLSSEIEALDFSHSVFGDMPSKFVTTRYRVGFLSRLRPPSTISEHESRLSEMREVVDDMRSQKINHKSSIEQNNQLLRTVVFFHVGGNSPAYDYKETSREEQIHQTSDRLLASCEFTVE